MELALAALRESLATLSASLSDQGVEPVGLQRLVQRMAADESRRLSEVGPAAFWGAWH